MNLLYYSICLIRINNIQENIIFKEKNSKINTQHFFLYK